MKLFAFDVCCSTSNKPCNIRHTLKINYENNAKLMYLANGNRKSLRLHRFQFKIVPKDRSRLISLSSKSLASLIVRADSAV